MNSTDTLEQAKNEILIQARGHGNAMYVMSVKGEEVLQIGPKRYNADLRERLVYLTAIERLEHQDFIVRIGTEMYELTYPGFLQSKLLSGIQSQEASLAVKKAKYDLLLGAAVNAGKFKEIDQNGTYVITANGIRYSESEEQRLLYFYALKRLVAAEHAESESPHGPHKLTNAGYLYALDHQTQGN